MENTTVFVYLSYYNIFLLFVYKINIYGIIAILMFLAKNNFSIVSVIVMLVFSFALGCFLISQSIFKAVHSGMDNAECCNSSMVSLTNHGIHDTQYTVVGGDILDFVLSLVLAIVVFVYTKDNRLVDYYSLIREKYGGFKLFYKFTLLFKTGLLHPKIF